MGQPLSTTTIIFGENSENYIILSHKQEIDVSEYEHIINYVVSGNYERIIKKYDVKNFYCSETFLKWLRQYTTESGNHTVLDFVMKNYSIYPHLDNSYNSVIRSQIIKIKI